MKGLRHLTIWMCVLAAVLGMGACSRAEKDEDVRVDMTAPAKDSPGERPVIRLWHIYGSDDDQAARIMEQLTREAEDKFNVTIEVDTAENEGYKTKIKAAAAANELPDIFYTWSHEFLKPMVDAGKVVQVEKDTDQIMFLATDAQGKEQIYKTGLWEDEALTNRLYKAGVTFGKVIPHKESALMNFLTTWILPF